MFHPLDQLRAGALFILTGAPGAGKSHLAASARRSGTIWLLDTEGAAQHLVGKPGIHAAIQVVQTLVLQAMRAHAQQRAGGDTERKVALSYDEHASINRNMQLIYTGLTELKHAGLHIILIGHLTKKYQTSGSALKDVGLRVLADEAISYEADAVLLVERNGRERTVTPIIKPPRPAHLQLDVRYPATVVTLDPDQAAAAHLPGKGQL
jgi:hypothetical protein